MYLPRFDNIGFIAASQTSVAPISLDREWFERRGSAYLVPRGIDVGIGHKDKSAPGFLASQSGYSPEVIEETARRNAALLSERRTGLPAQRQHSKVFAVSMHQIPEWQDHMAAHWRSQELADIPLLVYQTHEVPTPVSQELTRHAWAVLTSLRGEWGFDFSANADVIHLAGGFLEMCLSGFVEEAILRFLDFDDSQLLRLVFHTPFIFSREGFLGKEKKSFAQELNQTAEIRDARLKRALTMLVGRFALSDRTYHPHASRKNVVLEFK